MSETRSIDTGTDDLLARVEDGVAILTMNRPERRNALSDPMLEGMALALRDAEHADDVRCVVLTGAGGAFCAGGDVKGMAGEDVPGRRRAVGPHEAAHNQVLSQRPQEAGPSHNCPTNTRPVSWAFPFHVRAQDSGWRCLPM